MYKITFEGFPTLKMTDKIELPDMAELLMQPQLYRASLDDAYKYGGDFTRYLIEKAPLTHKRKHILVSSFIKHLNPFLGTVRAPTWHTDAGYHQDNITHILVANSSSIRTEFLEKEITLETDVDLTKMCQSNYVYYLNEVFPHKMVGKEIDSDMYVTFSHRHPHKINLPQDSHLRFFVNIIETDDILPSPKEQAFIAQSVSNYAHNESEYTSALEFSKDGIIIRNLFRWEK